MALFTPASARRDDEEGDGATLCELNGLLPLVRTAGDSDALRLYRASGGAQLPQLMSGLFGFSVPEGHKTELHAPPRQGIPVEHVVMPPPAAGGLAQVTSWLLGAVSSLVPGAEQHQRAEHEPPRAGRIRAVSWQSQRHALPTSDTSASANGVKGRQSNLCAVALEDSSVLLYDLCLHEWSPHRLVNTHQRDVRTLAWQPHSTSILVVGCAGGVCVWRLSYGRTTSELTGAHLVRRIDLALVQSLGWHPLGDWLAAASAGHDAVWLCEPWRRSDIAEQHTASGKAFGLHGYKASASDSWPATTSLLRMRGGGISLVAPSKCGALLFASGTSGALRVWETRAWTWQTWRRFCLPCSTATWGGPPPLHGDAPRLLLFAMANQPVLHAIRFTHVLAADNSPRFSGEYIGCFDLGLLAASGSLHTNFPLGQPQPTSPTSTKKARRSLAIMSLAWQVHSTLDLSLIHI